MCLVSSDRLAEILDVAEHGIVIVTADYKIVRFNRGATKIFGYLETEKSGPRKHWRLAGGRCTG